MRKLNINITEINRSVGYEFQLIRTLREESVLSDNGIDYNRKIAEMVCNRSKEANLREITTRSNEKALRREI